MKQDAHVYTWLPTPILVHLRVYIILPPYFSSTPTPSAGSHQIVGVPPTPCLKERMKEVDFILIVYEEHEVESESCAPQATYLTTISSIHTNPLQPSWMWRR